jgi:chemotaxis protein methyltransferase CheR
VEDNACVGFLQWALPRLGLYWPGFRRVRRQVCKRLGRRLADLGLEDLGAYRDRLAGDPAEWDRLDGLCRITISRFYRDRGVFQYLQASALPDLIRLAQSQHRPRLRIWSAGCGSAEEPYTLALMWCFGVRAPGLELEILGTDADSHLLERARRACYPPGTLRELPARWRAAFQADDDSLCLRAEYRSLVRFQQQDIRKVRPAGPFDLILCRNLAFTYFAPPLQLRLAHRLREHLVPGGLLVLGAHESIRQAIPGLETLRPWLYRCRSTRVSGQGSRARPAPPLSRGQGHGSSGGEQLSIRAMRSAASCLP